MRILHFMAALAGILLLLACQSPADKAVQIIPQLGSADPSIENKTVQDLVSIGAPAVEPLIITLKDNNAALRSGAARALGEIKDTRAIDPLISALQDADSTVRDTAAAALVSIGMPVIEPAIAAFSINNLDSKRGVIQVLGELNDPRAEGTLISALQDNDAEIKKTAASALGKAKSTRAIAQLISLFKDNNDGVRKTAQDALVSIGPSAVEPLIEILKDSETYIITGRSKLQIRQEAAVTLGRIRDSRAVNPLIKALIDPEENFQRDAADALVNIGAPAVEPLISALSSANPQEIASAAITLGRIKDSRAIQPLLDVIINNNIFVGHAAYAGLTYLGEAASPVLDRFLQDAARNKDLKIVASCYEYYLKRGEAGTETLLIDALYQYADAYGNYQHGMADCLLNCGNRELRQAAVMWGASNAFQLCPATPPLNIDGKTYYWGRCSATWGNKAPDFKEAYRFCRPTSY